MDRPDPNAVRIGSLRWRVALATRQQAQDTGSTGLLETNTGLTWIRADVQPIGSMTYYAAQQVDVGVSHTITIRWLDWVDTTCVVLRQTIRPDRTPRLERFRVRRTRDIDGRKRFTRLDCELEERG